MSSKPRPPATPPPPPPDDDPAKTDPGQQDAMEAPTEGTEAPPAFPGLVTGDHAGSSTKQDDPSTPTGGGEFPGLITGDHEGNPIESSDDEEDDEEDKDA